MVIVEFSSDIVWESLMGKLTYEQRFEGRLGEPHGWVFGK